MKKTAIIFLTFSLCLAADDMTKKAQKILKDMRQEISKMKPSLQNMQPSANSHQNQAPSSRDPEDLYGTWYNESLESSLYVTSGTDQTFPDFLSAKSAAALLSEQIDTGSSILPLRQALSHGWVHTLPSM